MELYYEVSLSAYILLHEVIKELKIYDTFEESRQNGNYKKILQRCNQIIETRYSEVKQKILKLYIETILINENGKVV
jgi:hypothetical protein